MIKTFNFEHGGQSFKASSEVFFADGMLKYRVAFQSMLIIICEISSSIGSSTGTDYVQEVKSNVTTLPGDLIQSIGIRLEDVDFFPGSFWVEFTHNNVEYWIQLIKNDNSYEIIYTIPADPESMALPIILKKEVKEKEILWSHNYFLPGPWFDEMVRVIELHEKGIE
jgi:hypothetical protein